MFENYVAAKNTKRRKWVTVILAISFVGHAAAGAAGVVYGYWVIEKLTPPKRELALAIAPPPPPPPPPPKASKKKPKPPPDKKVIKKIRPNETTQPVKKKKQDPDVEVVVVDEAEGEEDGVDLGQGAGSMEGLGLQVSVPGKKFAAPPPPPPPPPKPKVVPPKAVDQQRISGNKNIMPDEATKMQIQRDGNTRIVVSVKMCISKTGAVTSTRVVKKSGYPAYDRKITSQMRQWRYSPFMINGQPSPVCSSVMFVYVQN